VVEFGRYEMDTWYYSPYPEPYASHDKLYICEFTREFIVSVLPGAARLHLCAPAIAVKYFRKKKTLIRHLAKLEIRHPPGGPTGRMLAEQLSRPHLISVRRG
jgi:hypothetical protein